MTNRWALLLPLGIAVNGCSDSAAPAPGMFRAQLTGARVATLSGPSTGERNFTEEFPELHFVIRMQAPRGDTIQALMIRCRGDQSPAPGTHTIDLSGEDCVASYSRAVLMSQPGTIVRERMEAASGTLTIENPAAGQAAGTFAVEGTLRFDSDSVGILGASGRFSADLP